MKRTTAIILLSLIVLLILATFLTGVFGGPDAAPVLRGLLFFDVVFPAVIYLYLLFKKRKK